jgi:soluble lytic murein transglycosylase-like protein
MKFYVKVLILMVVLFGTVSLMSFNNKSSIIDRVNETGLIVNDSTPSIKMYNAIMKWSAEYDIPVQYAFALAYTESRYKGPAHVDYKSGLVSKSGALGPMQIKLGTAKLFLEDGEKVTKKLLRNDIDFNVMMSMRIIRELKDMYGTWGKAFGAYNTGKPIVNKYAKNILSNKFVWISIENKI